VPLFEFSHPVVLSQYLLYYVSVNTTKNLKKPAATSKDGKKKDKNRTKTMSRDRQEGKRTKKKEEPPPPHPTPAENHEV